LQRADPKIGAGARLFRRAKKSDAPINKEIGGKITKLALRPPAWQTLAKRKGRLFSPSGL